MTYCTTLTSVSCDCHSTCFFTLVGLLFLTSTTSVSVSVDSLTHVFLGLFGTHTGARRTVGAQTTLLAGEHILLGGEHTTLLRGEQSTKEEVKQLDI